ncbi:hypothetical protein SAMN04487891_11216 [Flagellimonas taeanensis]|uniref:Uncharacterized protein n=1 Tax=Flagellimonas taeanensis TaxID=1005926 RepID=A0A1M7BRG0_9FLAO|nr:hypothetical protein [Allomuricauda taeanensis]SFC48430.1 hypothetical protein SAMN04487891_11216 [Allomuricauda taeanensis]SHL57169.1 hypothetical protein SAMN05216293_3761 [Allomuricauda taeanensis]
MRKIALPLLLFACLSFTSCIDFKTKKSSSEPKPEDFTTVVVNDRYQIDIPRFMKSTTGLNDEASLQYQNLFKEAYTIVIDEPKDEFVDLFRELNSYDENLSLIENYRDIQLQLFNERMRVNTQSSPRSLKINGLDAQQVDMDAHVDGVDQEISYFLTFVEGPENVYMIMAWTLKSKKEEHAKTYGVTAESFGLLD